MHVFTVTNNQLIFDLLEGTGKITLIVYFQSYLKQDYFSILLNLLLAKLRFLSVYLYFGN